MAQRRKGSRPTNRLWKRDNQDIAENMVTERAECDSDAFKTPVLAMPPDIYDEFEALKNATHLDSTTLMRKLLQDYHRLPSPEHDSSTNETPSEMDDLRKQHSSSLFEHFSITQTSPPDANIPLQTSSPIATSPVQRSSPTTTIPVQMSSPITTIPVQMSSPITTIPVQMSSPITTIPAQISSPSATIPFQRSSPIATTSIQRSSPLATMPFQRSSPISAAQLSPNVLQTFPSTGNPTHRSSSVSPLMSAAIATSPVYRSSSASPLVESNMKTSLFQRSSTHSTNCSSREQPLDLSLLCKSESADTESGKDSASDVKDNSQMEINHAVINTNSSSLATPDISKLGFCPSDSTLIVASGVPSRYHVVMTPGINSEYSFLMPMPMSMQLPTVLASDSKQQNTVRIETASSSAGVNPGGIVGCGELGFSQLQPASLPMGVAVSQSQQQNLNILQTPLASQAGITQPQLSSSQMALHPQMMQQLAVSQLTENQTLTPLTVSQAIPRLSFQPQPTPTQSASSRTVLQQPLQHQSTIQLQHQSAVQQLQHQSVVQLQHQSTGQPIHQALQHQPVIQSQQTPNQPQAPARRGRRPGSRGGKNAKPAAGMGEMKIIQENITFPGVYTSILKLPWSRRARYRSQTGKETTTPKTTASSSVLFPMESAMTVSSASTSTVTDTHHEPSTTQSVMMVYPNATISALGKPVRRRGRPPKLPLISHLLAEKNSKTPVAITQVTTSIANQEAASMLADGSLMSFLSKESIGASVQNDIKDATMETSGQNEMNTHIAMDTSNVTALGDKMEICSPENANNSADEKAKADSMYQEMILSSRVLIRVKPRKRQLNDYMKSEDHFLCSSFKLKPRKTKPSRTAAAELADRRKHTRSDKGAESYSVGKTLAMLAAKLNHQTTSASKTIQEVTDHSSSNAGSYICEQGQTTMNLNPDNYPRNSGEIVNSQLAIHQTESETNSLENNHQENSVVLLCCKKCKALIKTISTTDAQMVQLNDVQCEKCNKALDNEDDSGKPEGGEVNKIYCDLCVNYFETPLQLCEHHREIHSKDQQANEDEYDCEYCGEVFCDVELLRSHVLSHKAHLLPCVMEDCPRFFSSEEELNKHVKEHEKKRLFTCVYDGCKKKFMKNFHLQEHVRVKHFNIRAFRCPWSGCEKQFAAERHLKVHLLIHREEKPLECEFCNYRCRQRNALNWHMRKHPEAPYKYRKFGMLGTGEDV